MSEDLPLILGIDIGTTSCKIALVTREQTPSIVHNTSRNFGNTTSCGPSAFGDMGQHKENNQDVSKIFNSLHLLISRISADFRSRIDAISVTGQMHGVIGWVGNNLAFNRGSKVYKNRLEVTSSSGGCGSLITWLDRRCDQRFLDLLPRAYTSQKPFSGFGCATILWHMKNKPGEFSRSPLSDEEEMSLFERSDVLRKISACNHLLLPVNLQKQSSSSSSSTGMENEDSKRVTRATSQIIPPALYSPFSGGDNNTHPPWTCAATIADFLVAGLAELKRPIMSPQMAMSWGYFDAVNKCWDKKALEAAGFPTHLLPDIRDCGTIVGKLAFNWEGIPAGADIFVALGDLQCTVYSSLLEEGNAACNFSTSAQIAFRMPSSYLPATTESLHCHSNGDTIFSQLLSEGKISIWPFFKSDEKVVVAATLNGGNIIDRFVKMLRTWCRQLGCAAMDDDQVYQRLVNIPVPQDRENSKDMIINPRLFGERYSCDERASVSRIQPDQLSLGYIYSALCESVVKNLSSMAPEELLLSANIKRIFCMGGALQRNPLLLSQMELEYPSLEHVVMTHSNQACVGAAIFTNSILMSELSTENVV